MGSIWSLISPRVEIFSSTEEREKIEKVLSSNEVKNFLKEIGVSLFEVVPVLFKGDDGTKIFLTLPFSSFAKRAFKQGVIVKRVVIYDSPIRAVVKGVILKGEDKIDFEHEVYLSEVKGISKRWEKRKIESLKKTAMLYVFRLYCDLPPLWEIGEVYDYIQSLKKEKEKGNESNENRVKVFFLGEKEKEEKEEKEIEERELDENRTEENSPQKEIREGKELNRKKLREDKEGEEVSKTEGIEETVESGDVEIEERKKELKEYIRGVYERVGMLRADFQRAFHRKILGRSVLLDDIDDAEKLEILAEEVYQRFESELEEED